MLRKILSFTAIIFMATVVCLSESQFCLAQEGDIMTEQRLRSLFDFIITLELTEIPEYMKHRNSKSDPVTKVKICYRLLPRPGKIRPFTDEIPYEEIYYEKGQPMGSRQVHELGLIAGESGCLRVIDSPALAEHPDVCANAIVRMYLDAVLKANTLGLVLVPQTNALAVQNCMPDNGFYPVDKQKPTGCRLTSMNMTFRAEPKLRKADNTYYYAMR